ncbi:MAG: hypothetical protein P8L79_10100 [Rhodospirillaceae bacterium]|jgi:hypothetical protein|nr:hypothetical protein [Rhodospirillaceae bacterium]
MTLTTVRLELARTKGHPDGNPNHGYEYYARLTDDGHLDEAAWPESKELCSVRRFEGDLEDEHGFYCTLVAGDGCFRMNLLTMMMSRFSDCLHTILRMANRFQLQSMMENNARLASLAL